MNESKTDVTNTRLIICHRADSKAFVEFLVGPEKQSFIISKNAVFKRHYFSDPHHGYLRLKGDIKDGQGWTIEIPSLQHIDPKPFSCTSLLLMLHIYRYYPLTEYLLLPDIAEYLENNEFGTTRVTDENRFTAFVECVEAWQIADKLAMHDLREHIVAKLAQAKPWDAALVLPFASIVYEDNGKGELDEQEELKGMLCDFISDRYYEIGMTYGVELIRTLRELPELAEIVHMKVAHRDFLKKRKNEENYREGHSGDGNGR